MVRCAMAIALVFAVLLPAACGNEEPARTSDGKTDATPRKKVEAKADEAPAAKDPMKEGY